MKNKNLKKVMLLVIIFILVISTGCTKTMVDKNNKAVKNPETGQSLTANILCKPTDKKLYNIYKKNEKSMPVKLKDLPTCDSFTPRKVKYESIWNSIFIKPLAWLILKLGKIVTNYGIAVMILGFLIRLIMLPFTKKTLIQSDNMQKAQPELKKIEKKYANRNDNEAMMAKSQEMMMVYKKYGISPMSGCLMSFIQLPLFFAFLEAINRVPAVFEESLLGLQLGTTPLKGISTGNYYYIILIFLIILTTYLSFKFSMSSNNNKDAQDQMQFMTKFMLIFISIASLSLPAAIGLYWIVTNGFAVVQSYILKLEKNKGNKKNNKKRIKSAKIKSVDKKNK